MDLDLGTIIIAIICTAICVVPFILMGRSRKKKEQMKLQSLTNIASQHDSRITLHEFCGNFGIAIDDKKGYVFFSKEVDGETIEDFVDLNQVQECKVRNTSISMAKNNETYKMTDRLDLCFEPISQNAKEIKWELFSRDHNLQLYGELQAAEKWNKLINQQIQIKVW